VQERARGAHHAKFGVARISPAAGTRVSSQSQLVTSEHIRAIPVASFYLHAGQVAPINSAEHGRRNYGKRAYTRHTQCSEVRFAYLSLMCVILKSPMTMKLLNATNARSKSMVNSSQRLQTWQTRQSTRHTILRCDEVTMWRVDWFPRFQWQCYLHIVTAVPKLRECQNHHNEFVRLTHITKQYVQYT